MRLFVAIDIAEPIRARIQRFMEGISGFAPEARWVRAESLHITLKFIGEKPDDSAEKIEAALQSVKFKPLQISLRDFGFFPSPTFSRIFWIGITASPELASLAAAVDQTLIPLEVAKEKHAFSPHITLARTGSGPPQRQEKDRPNSRFERLREKLVALPTPEFGTMTAHEFFLYESRLSAGGSQYTKIARFELQ